MWWMAACGVLLLYTISLHFRIRRLEKQITAILNHYENAARAMGQVRYY